MTSTTNEAPKREPPIMPKVSSVVRVPEARRVRAMAATGEPERRRQAASQPTPSPPVKPETPS